MRVTIKDQVAIPKPVRLSLGSKPGSQVESILLEGEAVLHPVDSEGSVRERRWPNSCRTSGVFVERWTWVG